jgi:hypothetical protein
MTPTPRAAVAWSTRKKQELIASFLLAEFDSLVVQARDCTEASATRINFFMITVAAAAAGLGAAGDLGLAAFVHLWLAFFACLFLLALGAITLWYSVRSAAQSMEMFRLAGRVRAWFANLAPLSPVTTNLSSQRTSGRCEGGGYRRRNKQYDGSLSSGHRSI